MHEHRTGASKKDNSHSQAIGIRTETIYSPRSLVKPSAKVSPYRITIFPTCRLRVGGLERTRRGVMV
ncbi:hypothetical protein CC2G_003640 [Coprinopsis cinerea AmutBmut pab1-1]|nr:hypothetical protein CC2G_003640 [Coprinopsis cinerea AmutBmut pab1-1]